MALTPSTVRHDLKCGKGSISQGEKCTKGPATKKKEASTLSKALMIGGAAAVAGGAIYGVRKYRKGMALAKSANDPGPGGKKPTPDEAIHKANKAFKEIERIPLAAEIAGSGAIVAGAGLFQYGKEKNNSAAMVGGAMLGYAGAANVLSAQSFKKELGFKKEEFNYKAGQYREQYNQARRQAQERARANEASGSQGTRNVGANKAVQDPFKDLGVTESASDAEIKKQWLKLVRANHPDAGGDPQKAATINAAYQEILRRRGKLDSIYADGFNIDWEAIAL